MATKNPVELMRERFGTKEKLVDQLLPKLALPEGESKDAFRKRISRVSNGKLMRLFDTITAVQTEHGGKAGLVDHILKFERPNGKKVDQDYRQALLKRSHGELKDRHDAHAKRAK